MKKYIALMVGLAILLMSQCFAQELPQSVRVGRVKANRSEYPNLDKGRSLKDEVLATHHDVERHPVVIDDFAKCVNCPPETPENNPRVKLAARYSDLVAVGTVVNNISSLTKNDAFIFTDSEFRIQEIWKGSVSPSVLEDGGNTDAITVTAPGGKVKILGHVVTVIPSNRMPLQIGHTYVLFLKYLPQSHSYKAFPQLIGFDLTGDSTVCLYTQIPPPSADIISNKSEYVAALRSSVDREVTAEENR